jgi:hypothetical protein
LKELAYKKLLFYIRKWKIWFENSKGSILAPAICDDIFEADYYYGISVIQKDSLFGYLQK